MMRTCALLVAMAALLVACGKYGPPRRTRSNATPAPATQPLESPASAPAEAEAAAEPREANEDQENQP